MATDRPPPPSSRYSRLLFLLTAIPLSILLFHTSPSPTLSYRSLGWLRECAKWDSLHRRFLVATFLDGGVSEVASDMRETPVLRDADVAGNMSLGLHVDGTRRRVVVVYADGVRMRYSAVGAYDLETWERIFLARLAGPEDEKSYADDVAVDHDGNAYVTDAKSSKIWKVDLKGNIVSVIRSLVFKQKPQWYNNLIGLNGIVCHPDGYLLVIHTSSGCLFKIDPSGTVEDVTLVKVGNGDGCSLRMGDGLELLTPTQLVVAGFAPSARLVESTDGWRTAKVKGRHWGAMHRIATSATVVDGRVYLNHLVGGGLTKARRTHVLAEAVFHPVEV